MTDSKIPDTYHPFVDLIGLRIDKHSNGHSECSMDVREDLFNPHRVVHGGVLFSIADTGMGAALYPSLKQDEICATIEIKITYFQAVRSGTIRCVTDVINRGKSVAHLEASIFCGDALVAKANGNYSIFTPRRQQ